MVSFELVSIRNEQLVRYYNLLAVQHYPLDDHRTPGKQRPLLCCLVTKACSKQIYSIDKCYWSTKLEPVSKLFLLWRYRRLRFDFFNVSFLKTLRWSKR